MRRQFIILMLLVPLFCLAQYNQVTNIPTVYINTHESKPITSKSTYIYADMVYVAGSDTVRYDSLQIRGRGNSTWNLAKKPYRIKFKESTKFLGKGYAKNKSWTLLANHADKSLLRNAVTSRMGAFLNMPFNPAAHFVDLVINGTYVGNYQVSDQVNVDNKRVEIFEQDYLADEYDNITGGYLLEIDGFAGSEPVYFTTGKGLLVTVKSPDEDVINQAQKDYISEYVDSYERALFSSDFTDPETGYRAMTDSATLVAWYIATELSANPDGFWSTYIYKEQDDPKIYFGPLWDYDIAYNNCIRVGDMTYSSMADEALGEDLAKVWVRRLVTDPWFNQAVNDAWTRNVADGLEAYLLNYIDSMAAHIDESQQLNYSRYSISSRVYDEVFLYTTYTDYITQLKEFITEHAEFLTSLFAARVNGDSVNIGGGGEVPGELLPFEPDTSFYYRIYNKGNNMVLDVSDDGKGIVVNTPKPDCNTQLWKVEKEGVYCRFINKGAGMALNDPSDVGAAAIQLNLAAIDVKDTRQLWQLFTVNENGNYNMINAYTNFVVNNSMGTSENGNPVIAYTNDDRNSVSNNRQWRVVPEESVPGAVPDDVKDMLMATVCEAETFLASLTAWNVGEAPFLYNSGKVDTLRRAVADARSFESTVKDDYVLRNVNLANALESARVLNVPSPMQQYVLRHRDSGFVLNVTTENVCIGTYEPENNSQHFIFEPSSEDGKYRIKSCNGLYVSLGTMNQWHMYGYQEIYNENNAAFTILPMDDHYRINAVNGVFATTYTDEGSKVYGNKHETQLGRNAFGEWLLEARQVGEDNQLQTKAAELVALVKEAGDMLAALPQSWVGDRPLQHSTANVNALEQTVASLRGVVYETVVEYDNAIALLGKAMADFALLNPVDCTKTYNLRSAGGVNLSTAFGLTVEVPEPGNAAQHFVLQSVEGKPNCYNIYSGGAYLSVSDETVPMFVFDDTPHGDNGCFVATQVADTLFTLTSIAGVVGVEVDAGNRVLPAVTDDSNAAWSLVEVTGVTAVDPIGYERDIDYAVRYNKERQTVGFVSPDIQAMATVDVRIYTTGGYLLYTFKATTEQSLSHLPGGTYIISWEWGGRKHSVRFLKE